MALRGLEDRAKVWTERGFISSEQAQKILTFENANPGRSWVASGVAAIGVVAITTGIISTIAANWQSIPDATKLALYFILQVALGIGVWRFSRKPGLARETLLSLFALTVLGGIGLVGQIFHLESDGWQALRFWLILILPITLLAQSKFLPNVWFAGLCVTLGVWYFSGQSVFSNTLEPITRFMLPLTFIYGTIAIGGISDKFECAHFIRAARLWGWFVLLGGVVTVTDGLWASKSIAEIPALPLSAVLAPFFASLVAAGAYFLRSRNFEERNGALVLMILAPLSFLLFILPLTMQWRGYELLGITFFLLEFSLAAAAAALLNRRRLFDLATFVIAARLIVAYFEVFGSLAATGIGLIISGAVILGAVWGWYRLRSYCAHLIAGKA
jgi:uncharacterized membrane protein